MNMKSVNTCAMYTAISINVYAGAQAEEYSVALMQPDYVEDLNAPWTAIFAVCRRHPNCINVYSIHVIIVLQY